MSHDTEMADKSHLPANIDHLEPRRVHKLVHKRVLRMVTIRQDAKGNFTALKRLPDDVREEYARRHGQRFEAKFFAAASTGAPEAKRLFREWETEVTARIDAIRAEHTGEGMALTLRQARALAGEWYVWFIARHPESDHRTWEALRDTVQDALKYAVGEVRWEESNPDDVWWNDAELRETVRPVLADVGETAQFLASKRLVLNNEARGFFLDWRLRVSLHLDFLSSRSSTLPARSWIQRSMLVTSSVRPYRCGYCADALMLQVLAGEINSWVSTKFFL